MSLIEKICYWLAWIVGAAFVSSFFPDVSGIIFIVAIVLAIVLSDKIFFRYEMKRKEKEERKARKRECLESLEKETPEKQELSDAVALIDYGVPGYGKCPKCGTQNSIGRQTCFGCGVPLKPFETPKQ